MTQQGRQPHLVVDNDISLFLVEEQDAEPLYRLVDANRAHLREWLPWLDGTQSVEDERAFIHRTQQQYKNGEGLSCLISYRDEVAGTIGFHGLNWINRQVEIGYMLGKSFEGKGIMTRSCRTMVDYAFRALNVNRVQIRCATGNVRSCAVPQRLGFTREGVVRQAEWLYDRFVDLVVYSMLVEEWQGES
jgi:ribosomal-protein-serine acetyltransferase